MTGKKASKIEGSSTRVYMEHVMKKVFHGEVTDRLDRLFSGDRETLQECATYLSKKLDYHQLLHTLCLVTGTRFDLEHEDRVRAADGWICWYEENKDRLVWDEAHQRWKVSP